MPRARRRPAAHRRGAALDAHPPRAPRAPSGTGFRRVLLGEDVPPIHDSPSSTPGHDGGFDLPEEVTGEQALATWRAEVTRAVEACAGRDPDARVPFAGGEVTLRWIHAHMIGEYARHAGHADLLRERIDGVTGV